MVGERETTNDIGDAMSLLTIIALVALGLLLINNFWNSVVNFIKSKTSDKVDKQIDEVTQLRNNLNTWILVRMLPNLSDKAIELLEQLKAELLKYPEDKDDLE